MIFCSNKNGIDVMKVRAWDSYSSVENETLLCTLITHDNYPIYTLDTTNKNAATNHIALGGGSDVGFFGVPAYVYDVFRDVNATK